MIFPAVALLFGAQAGDTPVPAEPTAEEIAACEDQFGDSYGIFACLGQHPGFSEETYEKCNAAFAAREETVADDDDGSAYFEMEREFTQCLGVFSAQYSPIDDVIARLPELHPLDYYTAASRLFFEENRKEEALFWFNAGQLRWRTRLECYPSEPGGESSLFGAMQAMVGSEINGFAAHDVDLWLATIDDALAWDAATPVRFVEYDPARCDPALANQRGQMKELRATILETRAEIEAKAKADDDAVEAAPDEGLDQ